MKRMMMVVVGLMSTALLGACANGSLNLTDAQKLHNLAVQVNTQCTVVQPFLASMKTLQTDPNAIALLGTVQDETTKVCATAAAVVNPPAGSTVVLNISTVSDYLNKQVPNLLSLVQSSGMSPQAKLAAELAITGAQTALSIAVANSQGAQTTTVTQ